jgi:hypothetical protein
MFGKFCAVLSLTAVPLLSQERPNPYRLELQLGATDAAVMAKLSTGQEMKPFFGVIIFSPFTDMIHPPGLPPLLATTLVLGAGWTDDVLAVQVPNQHLPIDLFCQGLGLVKGVVEASPVVTLPGSKADAAQDRHASADALKSQADADRDFSHVIN